MANPNKTQNSLLVIGLVSGFIGAALFFLVFIAANRNTFLENAANNNRGASAVSAVNFQPKSSEENNIVNVVKMAQPAVLSISVTKQVPNVPNTGSDRSLFDFYNLPVPNFPTNSGTGTGTTEEVGSGSAFLISSDGLAITNKHVVEDKSATLSATTNDGKKYSVSVVAIDPVLDVAIIKLKNSPTNMPYLTIDNTDPPVGSTAIAIGNALGEFQNTVSVGVISGLSRSLVASDPFGGIENLDEVLQTDAAINPGNSGGPLLNSEGKVIGVNVALAEGGQSVGFAVPGSAVAEVVQSVQQFGKIIRPYLGIRYMPITADLMSSEKLPVDYGVLVRSGNQSEPAVVPSSPAQKAGIVENDIILEIDNTKLDNNASLANIIRSKKVGDTVTLKILHNGKERTVSVKLEQISA